MSYKKVGGLHFFTLGRFGLTFYVKRRASCRAITAAAIGRAVKRKENLDRLRGSLHPIDLGELPREVTREPYGCNPYFER